jgi:hypothetical protein
MDTLGKFLQSGDWKGEKHVPIIHAPEKVKSGEGFDLKSFHRRCHQASQHIGAPYCMVQGVLPGRWG